jgi:SPP1 gp7 family putative phage head morphogenesis protein
MRKRVLPKRQPKPQSMDSPEREYLRKLNLYTSAYKKLIKQELDKILSDLKETAEKETPPSIATEARADAAYTIPYANDKSNPRRFHSKSEMRRITIMQSAVHMDAVNIEKKVAELFDTVQSALMKLFPDATLRKWASQMTSHVNQVSKKNTKRVGAAVDLDIEPLLTDGELSPYFKNVVDENIGLIRSIPEYKMSSFKNALVFAITNDSHNTNFYKEIEQYIGKNVTNTTARAKLIARDQVSKLNGKLNQYRQQKLGGEFYIWRTSEDERVRKDHKKLDGRKFSWEKPPVVDKKTGRRGHPGYDYQCRCTAEMVLDDIVD